MIEKLPLEEPLRSELIELAGFTFERAMERAGLPDIVRENFDVVECVDHGLIAPQSLPVSEGELKSWIEATMINTLIALYESLDVEGDSAQ